MNNSSVWKDQQINTEKARAFREIVTTGWANLSDGDVEASTGAFSLVHIEPREVPELIAAVFDGEAVHGAIYPGSYLVEEDSNGNTTVTEYLTLDKTLEAYNQLQREFALWGPACPDCGNEGPHARHKRGVALLGNNHLCACGNIFDPTEGVETTRSDMALDAEARKERNSTMMVHSSGADPHTYNDECEESGCFPIRPEAINELNEPDEKLYLVCSECGEAFDDIKIARAHCDNSTGHDDATFSVLPESEAM